MLGTFERGQTIDLAVIFVSNITGDLIDPNDPTVEIVHFDGTSEVIDLAETALTKVASRLVGYYTKEFIVPTSFALNEMFFVRWRGEDPNNCDDGKDLIEDHFKVVSSTGGSGSSGDCCCLVPRFSSC